MHLSSPVDDGELWQVGTRKGRGYHETNDREALCVSKLPSKAVNSQYSGIDELNTYGK